MTWIVPRPKNIEGLVETILHQAEFWQRHADKEHDQAVKASYLETAAALKEAAKLLSGPNQEELEKQAFQLTQCVLRNYFQSPDGFDSFLKNGRGTEIVAQTCRQLEQKGRR